MQALVITAYKNKIQLKKNLELFSKNFRCFVHIDKNSPLSAPDYIDELNSIENVTAFSKYKINWGSYMHMMAIVELLKMAVVQEDISRIHIISGEDFPVKSYDEFVEFFEKENSDKNFIELTDIRNMPFVKKRYEIFHFQHIFNRKSSHKSIIILDKIIRHIQLLLHVKRKVSFDYKGLVWSSLTKEGAECVIDYVTPQRVKTLKYCESCEEFIVQNALMSSPLKSTVVTDKKRFDNWDNCSTGPAVLKISQYEQIKASNDFFARKVQLNSDDSDASLLYEKLYQDYEKSL